MGAQLDDPAGALFLALLVDDKVKGTIIMVKGDKFIMAGDETQVRGINTEGVIIEMNSNEVVIKHESGQKQRIQYKLSTDKKTCDFTLADGSILHTVRMQ